MKIVWRAFNLIRNYHWLLLIESYSELFVWFLPRFCTVLVSLVVFRSPLRRTATPEEVVCGNTNSIDLAIYLAIDLAIDRPSY